MDYRVWALLSALFAGLTAVLSKKGVDGVPPNLALAVRVFFVLAFSVVLAVGTKQVGISELTGKNWGFLALSAVATWASWACYFRALADPNGTVSRVAPIDKLSFVIAVVLGAVLLKERVDAKLITGCGLIIAGVLLTLK
jgi:transporter family protein